MQLLVNINVIIMLFSISALPLDQQSSFLSHHIQPTTCTCVMLSCFTLSCCRLFDVTWELTVSDQVWVRARRRTSGELGRFSETSVTLRRSGGGSPNLQQISSLQLHAVRRLAPNFGGKMGKVAWHPSPEPEKPTVFCARSVRPGLRSFTVKGDPHTAGAATAFITLI